MINWILNGVEGVEIWDSNGSHGWKSGPQLEVRGRKSGLHFHVNVDLYIGPGDL